MRFMGGMAIAQNMSVISQNMSVIHFDQYFHCRQELRELKEQIRCELAAKNSYVECEDLIIINDGIDRGLHASDSPYPAFCNDVQPESCVGLITSSFLRRMGPSEALTFLSSALRWLDAVIHLLLRYFARP